MQDKNPKLKKSAHTIVNSLFTIHYSLFATFILLAGCTSAGAETPVTDTVRKAEAQPQENLVQQHPVDENTLPKDYFIAPMKIPMSLSATFGEIRSNHFHGGLDLRVGARWICT